MSKEKGGHSYERAQMPQASSNLDIDAMLRASNALI
jgi:hypothetical protein